MSNALITIIVLIVILALHVYICIKNPSKNRLTGIFRFLLGLVLLIVLVVFAVREYGPRGNNPIFSDAGRGGNEGDDTRQTSKGTASDTNGKVIIEIFVSGFEVSVDGVAYDCSGGDYGELDTVLSGLGGDRYKVKVIDHYGVSGVYHHVNGVLEGLGIDAEEVIQN